METEKKPSHSKVLILGDSNTKHLDQTLEEEGDLRVTRLKMDTAELLDKYTLENGNTISQADVVIIHVGTNDIRNKQKPTQAIDNIRKSHENIRQ